MSPLSDAQLVTRCRAGDHDAWNELVERYSRYVYAIAARGYRLAGTDAEDVFQDVFLRVYDRLDTLREDSALRPWIAQLTRRLCLDCIASHGRESSLDTLERAVEPAIEELHSALDVHEALGELDNACREILDRFFTRDQSYRTISDELGIPAGTVASRISRCLAKLRDRLEGRDVVASASGLATKL
ncbi:MAG: sigma-70 family RNA polymerase sigma factor [Actinobacteria bacterium]|nr:sigma-70 family RNA polymerase sigma factor [Actinomycetota bacterium]